MSQPFPEPAPDFSDPIGMLRACHKRMLSHCELLDKLANHLDKNGVDDDARSAAKKVVRYFSTAAVHHHEDEEQDLFPKVVRSSIKLATVIHELKQDHVKLTAAWKDLEPMLRQPQHIGDTEQFMALAQQFGDAYRRHIATEERDLLDVAQHMLSTEQLQEIGEAMQERRHRAAEG